MNIFKRYHWPGNFRQLHNLMRTAVVMVGCQGVIELSHLPDDFLEELEHGLPNPIPPRLMGSIGQAQPLPDAPNTAPMPDPTVPEGTRLEDVALSAMAQMLRLHKGNVSAAAKALGVSRNTIYRKKDLLPPGTL
jgi:transcriptional regulator of acetoin/glycerol metabolism